MIAEYNGKTYKCSFYKGKIILISDKYEDGFSEDFKGYSKTVDRPECDRVYHQEPRFLYNGEAFRYKEEVDGKILLVNNSKNGGFELRLEYDEYGKWVNISDGKKIMWTEEY